MIARLIEAVQAMDRGDASKEEAQEVFSVCRIPGFRFETWLAEMVQEGVYLQVT